MTTLFNQVLAYLRDKPDPPKRPSGSMVGREGIAAAAVTFGGLVPLRLLDHDKPVCLAWTRRARAASAIGDGAHQHRGISGAREWIDIYVPTLAGPLRATREPAVAYLPMQKKKSRLKVTEVGAYRSRR